MGMRLTRCQPFSSSATASSAYLPIPRSAIPGHTHARYPPRHSIPCCQAASASRNTSDPPQNAPPAVPSSTSVTSQAQSMQQYDIDFKKLADGMGNLRVRQHVNPLKRELQVPAGPLAWDEIFDDPHRPLAVDIGCGYGRFLLSLSPRMSHMNMLGLEIRKPIIDRANKWAEKLGCHRQVHFTMANATVSLPSLLDNLSAPLQLVTIQFPDPHFKVRHHKRRIVQPELVQHITQLMQPGGQTFLQSDVEEVAIHMRDTFERYGKDAFRLSPLHHTSPTFFSPPTLQDALAEDPGTPLVATTSHGSPAAGNSTATDNQHTADAQISSSAGSGSGDSSGDGVSGGAGETEVDSWVSNWTSGAWLVDNPLGVPTEREILTLEGGGQVFRVMLERI